MRFIHRKNKIAPELNIAYSVERIAYSRNIACSVERLAFSKSKNIFLSFLSAKRYPLSAKKSAIRYPLNALTGFTFIEMLIVTVMLSVVSLAVYASLSNGVKIWQRIYNQQAQEEELNIFLDRFASDIRNAQHCLPIVFLGDKNALSFGTVVNSREGQLSAVGKVSYAYNQQTGRLERGELDYSQAYNGRNPKVTHSLKDIRSFKFQYYYYSKEDKEYLFKDDADEEIPLALRIEFESWDGIKTNGFTKTVSIPIAG